MSDDKNVIDASNRFIKHHEHEPDTLTITSRVKPSAGFIWFAIKCAFKKEDLIFTSNFDKQMILDLFRHTP